MESIGSPPPRTVIGDPSPDRLGRNFRVPSATSVHCAGRRTTPSGTTPLYGTFFVNEIWQGAAFFFVSFFVRSERPVSSSRSALRSRRRAQELSRLPVAPTRGMLRPCQALP